MRQLVPVVRCDNCRSDIPADTRSSRVQFTWPDGSVVAFAGENCPECLDKLRLAMVELADEFLVLDNAQSKRARSVATKTPLRHDPTLDESLRTCTICGTDPEFPEPYVGPTRGALGTHLRSFHDTTLGALGLTLPGGRRS